ncbi:MAG TPA: pyrimidine/purine nucleoside phosphorylase [Desulfuromonadales bacterium]|nr:pyrimidine/purine nucleoside phosphorylase [Desulfuromonadales bacterium]
MSEFTNVTVVKKANIFFGGQVTSRSVLFPDGSKKTLGVMQEGEYEFSTDVNEVLEIMSGELEWQLQGERSWKKVRAGESFTVPAHNSFLLKVSAVTDYCCSFGK